MKRSRLSYDEWKCIISKDIHGKRVNSELLNGYIGLIDIKEVSKPQIWKFNGEDIVVCDKGRKWLSILPQNDWYCITAILVVYSDGTIVVDNMDELEDALSKNDITQEQFDLAVKTSHRLQQGILSNISSFIEYTSKCYEIVK